MILTVLSVLAPQLAPAQFSAPQTILTDGTLPRLHPIDLDGDGDMDLVGYFNNDEFKWAENVDGSGTLGVLTSLIFTGPIGAHRFGDVDGDGLPDLVYISENSVDLAISTGGAFGPATQIGVLSGEAGTLGLGDLTGDGALEIVISMNTGGTSRIGYFPNEGGSFGALSLISDEIDGAAPTIMLTGPIDEDQSTDIIFMNADNAAIGLMNVNGDASEWMGSPLFYLFDYQFITPELIDVDGDGDLDIAEAHQTVVQWAENRLSENIPFNEFTIRVIEPFMTAGIGDLADLGCDEGASVVFVPSDPGLPVRWSTYLNSISRFAPRRDLPAIARGQQLLLADMNGDGRADILVRNATGLLLYLNEIEPATTQLQMPVFDTVCVAGPSIALPDAIPSGGIWSGTWVTNNTFHRSSVGGTSTVPLAYTWYEPAGCPVAAISSMRVITGPQIEPFLGPIICSGDGPFQLTSSPQATQWDGLSAGNILDLAEYDGELIVAQFTDLTGTTCASFMGPLNIWNTVPVSIVPIDTLCVSAGIQTITAEFPWPNNSWSGDISGTEGENALFDPSQGEGVYTIYLDRQPTGPQQCANSDSITIVVNDDIPPIELTTPSAYCTSTSSIDLDAFAQPEGGTWSGPGVAGNVMLPFIAGPGTHQLTYTLASGGCTANAQTTIQLASNVVITSDQGTFSTCIDQAPIQFTATPEGGEWSAPVAGDGTFDPATAGLGQHDIIYVYTDPNGCMLVSPPTSIAVHEQPTIPVIDPVDVLCITDAPVELTGTPSGIWSGAVSGSGSTVTFDPAALGAGIWPVSLTAEEEGSCAGTTTIDVVVEICTTIEREDHREQITVSPNPTAGPFVISIGTSGPIKFGLFDVSGRSVQNTHRIVNGPAKLDLDLSGSANGVYHLRAESDTGIFQVKIVKTDRP